MNERLRQRIENFAGFDRAVPMPLSNTIDNSVPMPTSNTIDNSVPMPSGGSVDPMDKIENFQLIRDIVALGGRLSDAEISMYMNMTPEGIQQVRERENIDQMLNSMIEGTLEKPKNIFDYDKRGQLMDGRDNRFLEALIEGRGDAGTLSESQRQYFERMSPSYDVDIDGRDYQFEGDGGLDLMGLRQRLGLEPMYDATGTEFDEVMVMPEAEALSQMGRGKDTLLGHLEAGDVVVPPDVLENDPMLADILEERMAMAGVDPASRIAGVGIASLNPNTGLEEFGLFKSIKKVVKKAAPLRNNSSSIYRRIVSSFDWCWWRFTIW